MDPVARGSAVERLRAHLEPEPRLTPAEKLRLVLDLFEAGEMLMRQNLRRRHPEATEEEIERLLVAWLQTRPGAEFGDAEGTPVPWRDP